MNAKKWFVAMVVTALISAVSFCQINSYQADKHHFNGGWIVIGIVFAAAAAYCLHKVAQHTGNGPANNVR